MNDPDFLHPSFDSYSFTWYNSYGSPVSDVNIKGQAVGTSINPVGPFGVIANPEPNTTNTYAAFSAPGLQLHDYNSNDYNANPSSYVVDNLNNYIATIPGVYLTSAVAIDDLGRIIVGSGNNQFYLLTPVTLGGPSTVPEPTSLMMFGVVVSLIGLRSLGWRVQSVKNPRE